MFKKTMTFKDFEGNDRTDTFYFNLSEAELVELQVSEDGGFMQMLERIIETEDPQKLVAEFKSLILMSYGEKSPDGVHFMKSDEIRAKFEGHAVYSQLFLSFSRDAGAAAEFINGVMPASLADSVAKAEAKRASEATNVETQNVFEAPHGTPAETGAPTPPPFPHS